MSFLGRALWKPFSGLQKTLCFSEKFTLLHLVPIDEASTSSSMLRAVCVLCCCVREREQQLSDHRCGGVQIDTLEVGLYFQEELGEVFGHLAADRVLEGSYVRSGEQLCVTCDSASVMSGVGHEMARKVVHEGALGGCSPSWTICMPPLMFAANVTVTKTRKAKTWAESAFFFLEPSAQILRDSAASAQVDDAQL